MEYTKIQIIAIWIIPVLLAITIHEASHAWAAFKCGDKTAHMLGRTSFNPMVHIDLFGTILVPAVLLWLGGFVFGWAKPVPVITRNLRSPKRDIAIVAAAGPISNILMAIFWAVVAKISLQLYVTEHLWWGQPLYYMGMAGISINIILAVLNFLPIPPLDGSKVIAAFLPAKIDYEFQKLEPYGMYILIFLMVTNMLSAMVSPPYKYFYASIKELFGL
ncbi:MAG: site-2 protease family protein [Francisellaceae bacterium]|jgi:Zn-dependent protease|nr:site-2 protease family protein [Francisellaceae bacterium]MBT6206828.1 site-2 protease family protein [Francisellaceae bacterium]MBT6538381.1 site-2 protease family protein [Francisellaceae bacterium]